MRATAGEDMFALGRACGTALPWEDVMDGRAWLTLLLAGGANGLVVAALTARQWHPVWIGLISCVAVGVVFYVMDLINRRITR